MNGLGGSFLGFALSAAPQLMGMFSMKKQMDTMKLDAMENVNEDINGGELSEVAKSVTKDGKTKPAENYLKTADSKSTQNKSGLGFNI